MRKLSALALSFVCAFLFLFCEDSQVNDTIIGPGGGTITSRDGRVRITFPPGALDDATIVGILKLDHGNIPDEFAGLNPELGYLLLPEGIEFNIPVTVSVILDDQEPEQSDGSLVSPLVLLLTSLGGQIEILDNLVQQVNGDDNTVTVTGRLDHFFVLVIATSGASCIVDDIPDGVTVGGNFNAVAKVINNKGTFPGLLTAATSYSDIGSLTIVPQFSPLTLNTMPITDSPTQQTAQESFPYSCPAPGQGLYRAQINPVFQLSSGTFTGACQFIKGVTCGG